MDASSCKEITMTITSRHGEGYGFEIDGAQTPLRISAVSKGSPSSRAGLFKGDYLITVNGHSVKDSPLSKVQAIISYASGSPLTMKVARPVDSTSKKMQPQLVLNSLETSKFQSYQQAIGDATRSLQDVFDLLGPSVPKVSEERTEVEVAINLHEGSDQSTPPNSSPNQSDEEEGAGYDPLMDFSKGSDQYSYETPGHSSAVMVGSMIKAQQALQNIKSISEVASSKRQLKEQSNARPKVSTEATIEIGQGRKKKSSEDQLSESPPPPIPPYNPDTPDSFLLSNRSEYQFDLKKLRHSYEEVSLDNPHTIPSSSEGVVLRTKKPAEPPVPQIPNIEPVKVSKKDSLAVQEPTSKQRSFTPSSTLVALDPLKASQGLPGSVHSWKSDHVLQWLHKLNEQFSTMYSQCFMQHSITGHTLLHLNQNKLQTMGVDNKEHRMQLGMAIARLRLHHEQKELEKLSTHVSWL